MAYRIEFARSALREIKLLERAARRRIAARIDQLANNPFPPGVKKLQGEDDYYRICVGDFRVIYRVDGKRVTVLILKIGHRREVYR